MTYAEQLIEKLKATASSDERMGLLRAYAAKRDGRNTFDTYDYESGATKLAVQVAGLQPLAEDLLRRHDDDPAMRFLCLSIAFNGLRRERHFTRARLLLDMVAAEFDGVPLLLHYQAMSLQDGSVADMSQGLEYAERAHVRLPDSPGIAHTCAVFIAELVSNDAFPNPGPELERGIALVNEAIERHPRGRFFHTRARLRRLQQDYDRARIDIAKAIDLEDPKDSDSRERVASYLIERAMIDADRSLARIAKSAKESNDQLATETKRLKTALEGSQIQTIEVIGFVTAILGLVLATMGEIKAQSPTDALTVLSGVAVLLFSAVFLGSWMLRRRMR